jgi:hypothetical protein
VAACSSPCLSWASQPRPTDHSQKEPASGRRVRDFISHRSVPVDHMKAKPADRKACSLRPTYIHVIVMYQSNVFRAHTFWFIFIRVEIHRRLHSSATCIGRKAHGIPMMGNHLCRSHTSSIFSNNCRAVGGLLKCIHTYESSCTSSQLCRVHNGLSKDAYLKNDQGVM